MKQYQIKSVFKALSPISHISDSISTTSYLVQDPVIQDDGSVKEVFCYNGNALRGQLRDILAEHYAKHLNVKLSTDTFHLLFTGGKISGGQSIKLEEAKQYRDLFPAFSILGGGIGNQIISGKLKVGNSYPICQEAMPILDREYHDRAKIISYKSLTQEKSFTRTDDSKKVRVEGIMSDEMLKDILKEASKDEVSTQMRTTSELLVPGAELANEIILENASQEELGALLLAFQRLSLNPYIGGQSNKGHGKISIASTLYTEDGGAFSVFEEDGGISKTASRLIDKYISKLDEISEVFRGDEKLAKKMGVVCL